MIEYKVFNETTKDQIRKLIEIGSKKAKKRTLKDVIKANEQKRKVLKKLDALKEQIAKM